MPNYFRKGFAVQDKRMILVVDDEEINRSILGGILEPYYKVIYASNGTETIEKIYENRDLLSLILLDLILPDIHGLDILKTIKTDERLSGIPVIVLTADSDAEVECLESGAIDFIPKPYPKPRVIHARVQHSIDLSESHATISTTERDSLTGLYNREYFYHYARQFDLYHKDFPMDAIVIDVNHFHMINERYGEAQGDAILKCIAEKIVEVVQPAGGLVCRQEADTFLIYCLHRNDYSAILEHVSAGLVTGTITDNRIRMRMGIYSEVDKSLDIERCFDRAKQAADSIRDSFAKSVAVYDNALHELELFEERLLEDFHSAIESKQFLAYYQPKFDLRYDRPVLASAEALVRWDHSELGMISPGVFIPLFEHYGLIRELDHYVWREVCEQMQKWKRLPGITVPVSINVSRIDMYDSELVPHLQQLLVEYELTTEDILLEITESAYTQDSEQIIETVARLRKLGFRVEMDDFGTGYSSLNMISTLPIDALKLDLQFIRHAFNERKDTRMLSVVLDIADTLEVPTIAEGVETAEQLSVLKSMGCDYAQGYYFSKPIPAKEFEVFLQEKKQMDMAGPEAEPRTEKPVREKQPRGEAAGNITYDALHDPVTGLYNHSGYDLLIKDIDTSHVAMIIAEVDDYQFICERYGQAVANGATKKIADVLRGNFRSVDYIFRISKDEFVIIVSRIDRTLHDRILAKVMQMNTLVNEGEADLPPLSLSMGIAFSERENPQGDLFQDADTALNRLKESGRRGYAVY